jgi:hypothetical protein
MTSKQRVFSHSTDINYNDYIKNKNGVEIFKNIKNNNRSHFHNPNNLIIKKFANHQDLINFTKTYYNYVNLNKYSLKATTNLYNSNISIVDANANAKINFKQENDDCNDCNNSNYYNECLNLSQVLYPESYYVSNNLSGIHLHFNLDLNKWCVNNKVLDYNKIYNVDNNIINIDGFNGCTNNDKCYTLQSVRNNDNDNDSVNHNKMIQKRKKCRTGMCGNAKPLFV